jgi:FkbM family methyltransferase
MRRFIKLLHLLIHHTYRKGLRYGVGGAIEHSAFLRSMPIVTIIDVGANKGQFSLAARRELPDAKIFAFEPLSKPYAICSQLFRNDGAISITHAALGSISGTADIHVSRSDDSSSLLPIGKLQSQIFSGTEEVGVERVLVMKLDDAIPAEKLEHPAILKMDVQGFELEVLKGGEKFLQSVDGIYLELSFMPLYERQPLAHEVLKWLEFRGFHLAGVYNVAYSKTGVAVQADMYFRKGGAVGR